MQQPNRRSVDLSAYPDLVVIYLGYRANAPRGLLSLMRIGLGLRRIQAAFPKGLLAHEFFLLGPLHVGFRQYWTDLKSLQEFTRAPRHAAWWASFGKDAKGGGFWHETYCRTGGIEAMYIDMPKIGLGRFAPVLDPVGPAMTSAQRLGR
jgi:hypothetical protein